MMIYIPTPFCSTLTEKNAFILVASSSVIYDEINRHATEFSCFGKLSKKCKFSTNYLTVQSFKVPIAAN